MIPQAQHAAPERPLTRRGRLVGVRRSGYDAHLAPASDAPADVARRDAIAHLVLDVPGDRRGTTHRPRAGWR